MLRKLLPVMLLVASMLLFADQNVALAGPAAPECLAVTQETRVYRMESEEEYSTLSYDYDPAFPPAPEVLVGMTDPIFPSVVIETTVHPNWGLSMCGGWVWFVPANVVRIQIPGTDPLETLTAEWQIARRWFFQPGYRPTSEPHFQYLCLTMSNWTSPVPPAPATYPQWFADNIGGTAPQWTPISGTANHWQFSARVIGPNARLCASSGEVVYGVWDPAAGTWVEARLTGGACTADEIDYARWEPVP